MCAVALLSFFVLGNVFSKPETYQGIVDSLDSKQDTVLGLVAVSTASSAGLTLLPGDVATPIADKLVDLSLDFGIVLAAIFLEKYLLTMFGAATFRILIPIACVTLAASAYVDKHPEMRMTLQGLAAKFILLGLSLVLVVPSSVFVSNMIESTYQESIDQTVAEAQQTQEEMAAIAEGAVAQDGSSSSSGILQTLTQLPQSIASVPDKVSDLSKQAEETFANLVEALAVMIVTTCLIPILVLAFFLWLMKMILGVNIYVPLGQKGLRPPAAQAQPRS